MHPETRRQVALIVQTRTSWNMAVQDVSCMRSVTFIALTIHFIIFIIYFIYYTMFMSCILNLPQYDYPK